MRLYLNAYQSANFGFRPWFYTVLATNFRLHGVFLGGNRLNGRLP